LALKVKNPSKKKQTIAVMKREDNPGTGGRQRGGRVKGKKGGLCQAARNEAKEKDRVRNLQIKD